MPPQIVGQQVSRVKVVDDDPAAREAMAYTVTAIIGYGDHTQPSPVPRRWQVYTERTVQRSCVRAGVQPTSMLCDSTFDTYRL
jgi:hypothetical protein